MQHHEHLRAPETPPQRRAPQVSSDMRLSREQVEKVFAKRIEMLEQVSRFLSPSQLERLAKKIQHEQQALTTFIEHDTQVIETRKKAQKVLDSNFFTQKSLDTNF